MDILLFLIEIEVSDRKLCTNQLIVHRFKKKNLLKLYLN